MIKFENVSFQYNPNEDVLKNVSFALDSGSYHFLSGPSGSGKTSLMNLMYLGNLPTSGKITLFGKDISLISRRERFMLRQKIGVVFQDFRLLNHLTTFDNIALPLRIMNRPEEEIQNHVSELLDWVGLGNHGSHHPNTLSGGQQQRIAVARAIIGRPKILLADEPTGNLDDEIGFRLMGLFEQLNKLGTTIIIATHNLQMMEQFGHPRLSLAGGKVMSETRKKLIIKKIRHVY